MNNTKYPRKRYLIKRAFQLKFVGVFVILLAAGAAISGTMLYFLASREIATSLMSAHLALKSTWEILMPAVIITNLSTILLIALATIFFVLYYTNRVAGPLYRLERTALTVGEGDLTVQVRFRERDEIADFREAFQSMVDSLAAKVRSFRGPAKELAALTVNLRGIIESSSLDDTGKKDLIRSLESIAADLERASGGFTLSSPPV